MKLVASLSIVFILLLGISCKKDDNQNVTYTATLNGANEVPANNSTATGTATLTFNKDTKVFNLVVTHTVLGPTAGHIHEGAPGENGGVVFGFISADSPIEFTEGPLTTAQEADLNAGLYYVNIQTLAYPGGEIRGQLVKK